MNTILSMIILKATVLLALPWLASLVLRRSSAAYRHLIWSGAVVAILILPILSFTFPKWSLYLLPAQHTAGLLPTAFQQSTPPIGSSSSKFYLEAAKGKGGYPSSRENNTAGTATAPAPQTLSIQKIADKPWIHFDLVMMIIMVWTVGAAIVLLQLLAGFVWMKGQLRNTITAPDRVQHIGMKAMREIGLTRRITILQSQAAGIDVPVTWGVLRPVILLPHPSTGWSDDCIRACLLHEIAHVKRLDWPVQIAAHVTCAVYWFHPLAWAAARQVRAESERASDDCVLSCGMRPVEYAQELLTVARSLPSGSRRSTAAVAMAQPSDVKARLMALLASDASRSPLSRRRCLAALTILAIIVVPMAAVRLAARAQQSSTPSILDSVATAPDQVTRRTARGILSFEYLPEVACPTYPSRPISVSGTMDANGQVSLVFTDKRTGQTFRDMPHIRQDVLRVIAQGTKSRAGTVNVRVSNDMGWLMQPSIPTVYTAGLYLDPSQARQLALLTQELKYWRRTEFVNIINDGDIEPNAKLDSKGNMVISISPAGVEKLAAFSHVHHGECLALWDHDGPFSVSTIEGTLGAEMTITRECETPKEFTAMADQLNSPSGTQTMGTGVQRFTEAKPSCLTFEADWDPSMQVPVAAAYSATLANGYKVAISGLTECRSKDGNWYNGGPWWGPDGSPQHRGATTAYDQWSWPINITHGVNPHSIHLWITPPSGIESPGDPISEYWELRGTSGEPWERKFSRRNNMNAGTPAGGFDTEPDVPYAVKATTADPNVNRSGILRYGLASGTWQTVATLTVNLSTAGVGINPDGNSSFEVKMDDRPALLYTDKSGTNQCRYFLEGNQRIGNVARRIVEVDRSGKVTPLTWAFATGALDTPFYQQTASDVSRIKQYHLQTRPYDFVEFRNIALNALPATIQQHSSTAPSQKHE